MRYAVHNYTLDIESYELCRPGVRIPMQPKVSQLPAYLITYWDRVVLKDKLIGHLWSNQITSDTALKSYNLAAR
jgi:DNA-binding winged helix-turn-helix (wHTH) protein